MKSIQESYFVKEIRDTASLIKIWDSLFTVIMIWTRFVSRTADIN